jgi:hypothetical protein
VILGVIEQEVGLRPPLTVFPLKLGTEPGDEEPKGVRVVVAYPYLEPTSALAADGGYDVDVLKPLSLSLEKLLVWHTPSSLLEVGPLQGALVNVDDFNP